MASLHDVLDFALHLADVQASDCELLLQLADGVHVEFEVKFGPSNGRADLREVSKEVREEFGNSFALVSRQVPKLLELGCRTC